MKKTSCQIRENYQRIKNKGIRITPMKMNVILILPVTMLSFIMGFVFRSDFGNRFMYRHSMKAPDEMRGLHERFYRFISDQT